MSILNLVTNPNPLLQKGDIVRDPLVLPPLLLMSHLRTGNFSLKLPNAEIKQLSFCNQYVSIGVFYLNYSFCKMWVFDLNNLDRRCWKGFVRNEIPGNIRRDVVIFWLMLKVTV